MRTAPLVSLFRPPKPKRRKARSYEVVTDTVPARYGSVDPAVSFKRSASPGYEGEPTRTDWVDVVSSQAFAARYEERVSARLLRPSRTFEPDYDEDPADAVRTAPAVNEWRSPISRRDYPRVEIGERYRTSLPIAERALALRAESRSMPADEIVMTLSVEFDLGWDLVVEELMWMGVEDDVWPFKRRSDFGVPRVGVAAGVDPPERFADPAGGPLHGTNSRYCSAKHRCRCDACRHAHRIATRSYVRH